MSDVPNGQETVLRPTANGFLESNRIDRISAEIKAKIIEMYRQTGDLTASAKAFGVAPSVARWHRQYDDAFREACDESIEQLSDRAEGSIVQNFSKTPADRIFWLKTRRRHIYGDQLQVTANHQHEIIGKLHERIFSKRQSESIDTTAEDSSHT